MNNQDLAEDKIYTENQELEAEMNSRTAQIRQHNKTCLMSMNSRL